MTLTLYHRYLLDCLRQIPFIHRQNLFWLMQRKFETNATQFERDIALLQKMRYLATHEQDAGAISLPGQKENKLLSMATDIMREVCGQSLPEILRGTPPCVLSFYIQDSRGYLDFKVVPVAFGAEQLILEQLRQSYPTFKCTWLFLPESRSQIEKLHTENPACFVFRNNAGGYDFLRKS